MKLTVAAAAAVLLVSGGVFAWFKSTGSANASGVIGSLNAPGKPSTLVTGTTVHVSWSAATLSSGSSTGIKYHVERRPDPGSTWTNVCSSSAASPIAGTSCDDSPGTGTFVYRVTAHYASWTAMGPESDPVIAQIVATKLVFLTSSVTTTAGVTSGTITIERQNASGTPGTAGNATITLASSAGTGIFRNTGDSATITTVSIPDGSSDASFKYRDTTAGTPTLTVTDTPDGLTQASQSATITPASATTLTVSGYPTSTVAGVSHGFTVTAKDPFGNTDTNYAGTVHFTASNDAAAVLPANSTLSSGTGTFNATFKTVAGGPKTLTATDTGTSSITGSQSGITITPASASTLTVSGYPTSTVAGVSHSFTVTAKDQFGNTDTNYAGTVHFTASNDAAAVLPANSTLSSGTGTFNATFKTVAGGPKTLTATDTATSSITGSESGITVTPGSASSFTVAGYPASTVAGVSHGLTVTAKDQFGNTDTNYAGTVHFTATNDGAAVLPADSTLPLGSGTGSFNATFKTVSGGTKTLTATDTLITSITGSQSGITVTPDTASTLVFSTQPGNATAGSAFGQQPVVKTRDQFGNNSTVGLGASRNVTIAIASGGGTLQGTATVDLGTSAGNGTATFTTLRIDQAGAKTLSATAVAGSPALSAVTSNSFTVSPTTASKLVFSTQPGGATAGSAFTQQPVVTTQDQFNNDSTVGLGASRSVTIAIASGGGTLQGTATVDLGTSAGNGTATYTSLRIDQAGAKTLSATAAAGSPTLSAGTSSSFTVSAGAATTIAKMAGDSQSIPINNAATTALKVTVTDAFSNPVSGVMVTFAAPGTGASGTFAGGANTATTLADGTATAATFTANSTAGNYAVSASASGTNTVNFGLTNYAPWAWATNGPAQTWTTATAKSVTYPTGTTSGDLLLLTVVQPGNINTATATPASWNLLGSMKQGSSIRTTVFWRAAGAETSVSVTPSTASASAWIVRYVRSGGVGPAPSLAATALTGGANANLTFGAPGVTTTGPNATVVSIVGIDAATALSLSAAQSFVAEAALTTATPATGFGLADRFVAASGTAVTGPTWQQSSSSANWSAVTGAFN